MDYRDLKPKTYQKIVDIAQEDDYNLVPSAFCNKVMTSIAKNGVMETVKCYDLDMDLVAEIGTQIKRYKK